MYFEAPALTGWLANSLASQPIRTRTSKSNIFVFMIRWPTLPTASIDFSSICILLLLVGYLIFFYT